MINQLSSWLFQAALVLSKQPRHLLILRLTALLLLLYPPPYAPLEKTILPVLGGSILVYPQLLKHRILWLIIFICLTINNIYFWFKYDNHHYLTTYWVLVCLLAVKTKDAEEILSKNGKLLIGLCFLFATFWKLIAGEYLDGSFLHFTFLVDRRLEIVGKWLGGLDAQILQQNQELLKSLSTSQPGLAVTLVSSPLLATVSLVLSYWTLLIEGLIGCAFLSTRPLWLHNRRDWLLIVFMITTYPLAAVYGFAALLSLIGFAQCSARQPIRLAIYLLLFLLLPLWLPLSREILRVLTYLCS